MGWDFVSVEMEEFAANLNMAGLLTFTSQPRGLVNFISDIRHVKSKDDERKRIDKELGNIRLKFSQSSTLTSYQKKKYVWKMCYIYMLGYDIDRKQMEDETRERLLSLENLPTLREQELERTLLTSSLDNSDTSHLRPPSKPLSSQEEKLKRQERRKQVQARMLQEQEQRKLSQNHYR